MADAENAPQDENVNTSNVNPTVKIDDATTKQTFSGLKKTNNMHPVAHGHYMDGFARIMTRGYEDPGLDEALALLEQMQEEQYSWQQPNPAIDHFLQQILGDRPEWRQRLAVQTKSALLRKKILSSVPPGGRAVGCEVYGAMHPWRHSMPIAHYKSYSSDHNWPKVNPVEGKLPNGTLTAPVERCPHDPHIKKSARYSIGNAQRFKPLVKDNSPGPGSYGQELFVKIWNKGETVVMGTNNPYPCKGAMSEEVTMVKGNHQPCWTFSKMRRVASEPWERAAFQGSSNTAVKTDMALSPGPIYTHYTSFHPGNPNALTRPARNRTERLYKAMTTREAKGWHGGSEAVVEKTLKTRTKHS